jgi:hypothetical protein
VLLNALGVHSTIRVSAWCSCRPSHLIRRVAHSLRPSCVDDSGCSRIPARQTRINQATHDQDQLARIAGVADVVFLGRRESTIRIRLDADKLAGLNLTMNDVTKTRPCVFAGSDDVRRGR